MITAFGGQVDESAALNGQKTALAVRDDRGRFLKGCAPGPGRPPMATEKQYAEATIGNCTLDDWTQIVRRAVEDAKAGDPRAREWLAKYLLPAEPLALRLKVESDESEPSDSVARARTVLDAFRVLAELGLIEPTPAGCALLLNDPDPSAHEILEGVGS